MMENGKISGENAKSVTGSEILRMRWGKNSDSKKIYHLGFSIMYNHIKESNGDMKLNDFFSKMPQSMGDNCKMETPSFFSKENEHYQIPIIGGKSIPISFLQCTASGRTTMTRDCYGIRSRTKGTVRLQMNISGPKTGCNGAQVIHIQVSSQFEDVFRNAYGD